MINEKPKWFHSQMTPFSMPDKSVYRFTVCEMAELQENLVVDNQQKRLTIIKNAFGCAFDRSLYIDEQVKNKFLLGDWPKL
jgi:hypothetical protein